MSEVSRDTLNAITRQVIGCAYAVSNGLGSGFLEKVYENALTHDIRKAGLLVVQQQPIPVYYDGVLVGECVADLVVAECVLVELKAVRALDDIHRAQCLNYLKATRYRVCLLLNFGKLRVEVERIVLNF